MHPAALRLPRFRIQQRAAVKHMACWHPYRKSAAAIRVLSARQSNLAVLLGYAGDESEPASPAAAGVTRLPKHTAIQVCQWRLVATLDPSMTMQ